MRGKFPLTFWFVRTKSNEPLESGTVAHVTSTAGVFGSTRRENTFTTPLQDRAQNSDGAQMKLRDLVFASNGRIQLEKLRDLLFDFEGRIESSTILASVARIDYINRAHVRAGILATTIGREQ